MAKVVSQALDSPFVTVHPVLDIVVQLLHPPPLLLQLPGVDHAHHINVWSFALFFLE